MRNIENYAFLITEMRTCDQVDKQLTSKNLNVLERMTLSRSSYSMHSRHNNICTGFCTVRFLSLLCFVTLFVVSLSHLNLKCTYSSSYSPSPFVCWKTQLAVG